MAANEVIIRNLTSSSILIVMDGMYAEIPFKDSCIIKMDKETYKLYALANGGNRRHIPENLNYLGIPIEVIDTQAEQLSFKQC